jgi:hypothetical protein
MDEAAWKAEPKEFKVSRSQDAGARASAGRSEDVRAP